jgi:hypothetical protein
MASFDRGETREAAQGNALGNPSQNEYSPERAAQSGIR